VDLHFVVAQGAERELFEVAGEGGWRDSERLVACQKVSGSLSETMTYLISSIKKDVRWALT